MVFISVVYWWKAWPCTLTLRQYHNQSLKQASNLAEADILTLCCKIIRCVIPPSPAVASIFHGLTWLCQHVGSVAGVSCVYSPVSTLRFPRPSPVTLYLHHSVIQKKTLNTWLNWTSYKVERSIWRILYNEFKVVYYGLHPMYSWETLCYYYAYFKFRALWAHNYLLRGPCAGSKEFKFEFF